MSFQFQFDVTADSSPLRQSAPRQDEGGTSRSSASDEQKPRFQSIKDASERLRDRRGEKLEYETIDLNCALGDDDATVVTPLRQVCNNVGTGPESDSLIREISCGKTDLLPGVYEGGLKVWECSLDLCRSLALHCDELLENGGKVLELGCGHALPACLLLREALKKNKDVSVMFTDYNDFVLHGVTLSNIVLNTQSLSTTTENFDSVLAENLFLGSGDWMDMSEQLASGVLQQDNPALPRNGRFDVILAAETTYTAESAKDTATLLARHLKPGSGAGLVACKRYYFGVGGGSDAFREAAASQRITAEDEDSSSANEYRLSVETLQVYDNGVGNIRELLKIKCVPSL